MSYLLHIDTSADVGTVAISKDGMLVAERSTAQNREYAALINNMIADVLHEAGIALKDIDAVVVCAGPGSYTGLRIGLSTAKGLCYVLDKPLLLDNKLTLLAWQAFEQHKQFDNYVSILNARAQEYFICVYDNKFNDRVHPQHIHIAEFKNLADSMRGTVLITGEVNDEVSELFKMKNPLILAENKIDMRVWAMYAYEQYKCNRFVSLASSEPFYLKNFYTNKPLPNPLQD